MSNGQLPKGRTQYQTKQRDELLNFLKSVKGEHITVNDVVEHLSRQGKRIGTTTVYRQLEKMVEQGLVAKYIIDPGSPACFEYISENDHVPEGKCYHCICISCGKLIHMHCDEISRIQEHIKEDHGFTVDPFRTVFYGICEDCTGSE